MLVGSADALAAAGLRSLLAVVPDFELIGQGIGAPRAAALAAQSVPDVLVYDGGSGGNTLPELLSELRERDVATAVLWLSIPTDGIAVAVALRQGVRGYLPRTSPPEDLEAAIRALADGLVVLHPTVAGLLAAEFAAVPLIDAGPPEEPLTAREREVLQLLAQGLANKQIAQRLKISEHTVKFHVAEVMAKLGAASRTEAVTRAARRGLLVL